MRRLIVSLLALLLAASPAFAQSSPGLTTGQVPTAAQWNSYFASKQDVLGFTALNVAGGTMGGRLVTSVPSAAGSGFRLPPGTAPTSPTNGDLWSTSAGLFVRVAGTTIGPLSGGTSSSFAATAPLAVTFPAGVVTYAVNGSALTRVDDTNVTLTLGGTPATALLQATSLTLGWTGQLAMTRGGSGASLVASNGGIVWTDANSMEVLAGTATANRMLLSGATATPAWSTATIPPTATGTGTILRADGTNWAATTATYPATTTVSQILYSSSANVIGGITTGNNGALITSAGGVPSISSTLPNAVQDNITRLGTVTTGTWTGTTIAVANGGTGDTGTAWSSSTPSIACGAGTMTSGTATLRVKSIGKTTFVNLSIAITTNGTCASFITVAVPTGNAAARAYLFGANVTAGVPIIKGVLATGSATLLVTNATDTYPGADATTLVISGVYEAQ